MVSLKTVAVVALGVLTLGLIARSASGNTHSSSPFPVPFHIFDSETDNAINGAIVDLNGVTATTDSSGNATFQNWTELGNIPFSVSATGYNTNSGNANIIAGVDYTANPFEVPLQAIQTGPPTILYYFVNDIAGGQECASGGQFTTETDAINYANTITLGGTDPCNLSPVVSVTVYAAMSDGTAVSVWTNPSS